MIGCIVATAAFGAILTLAFEPDVQEAGAAELVARSEDARAFLVADLFFPVLHGVLLPLAMWRFGRPMTDGQAPRWVVAAALLLAGAGLCDWAENALLLSATGSESPDAVDAAHLVAVPKIALFVAGAILASALLVRAVMFLRPSGQPS